MNDDEETAETETKEFEREEPSGEHVYCDLCGQNVLRGEGHKALCGLACEGGRPGLDDEVTHDEDCPLCL